MSEQSTPSAGGQTAATPEGDNLLGTVDAIVLGGGISGLVSAAILADQGARQIYLVDEYPTIGGNHQNREVGPYTFDVGSFIFQDDSPLLSWFPELLERYVPIHPTWSRLNPQGRVTRYPFSLRDDLLRFGPLGVLMISMSLVTSRARCAQLTNAQDFVEYWLGKRFVAQSGLGAYMERFCGVPLSQIDLEFAKARLGWIPAHARILPHIQQMMSNTLRRLRTGRRRSPTNQQLARPREGFAFLYEPTRKILEARNVEFILGQKITSIERQESKGKGAAFSVNVGARSIMARRIVSTIPLSECMRLSGLPVPVLPSLTLVSLFFSFTGVRGFDTSILYNFSNEGAWKRLTVYSDFYGEAEGRQYLTVEVVHAGGAISIEDESERFRAHAITNGLLHGDLRLEGANVLHEAYPIYVRGSAARAAASRAALSKFGIESFGRQGGFTYQPTARVSTQQAEEALGADRTASLP